MSQNIEVLEKLFDRANGKADKSKIALFLPGGGMRGAFSGGVVSVINELGLSESFDYIYGFSSGAFSGAYMLSGNPELGTTIYFEDLSEGRFIQPLKLSHSMNLDYFCDEVVRNRKKLNLEKIRNAKPIFKVFVTNPISCKREFYTNRDDIDLIKVLKASCAYPGFCSSDLFEQGTSLIDGNALDLIPMKEAIKDGCTDVLVVSNVPETYKESRFDFLRLVSAFFLRKLPIEFRQKYKTAFKNYNHDLDLVFGRKELKKINIYTISPIYTIGVGDDSKDVLRRFSMHGVEKAKEAFEIKNSIQK